MFAQERLRRKETRDVMYRSNSSLDLIYIEHPSTNGLRREYGSHGSIDVIGDRAPGMVHTYNGLPGPEKPAGMGRPPQRIADIMTTDHADGPIPRPSASPKPRLKFNKLWGGATPNMSRQTLEDTSIIGENDSAKRKLFAHYDCQSLMANLSYAAEARGMLLSRRRNTTTGASAASLLAARGAPPGDITVPDTGDGRSNELIDSCPFFRNEVGGEEERCVSLCWKTSRGAIPNHSGGWHRPKAAYGLSVLEYPPGQTHWKHGCPFGVFHNTLPIESQDLGALYYRNYFYTQPHQNWFGMDDSLGPVAISIRKERVELRRGTADTAAPASLLAWQYRLVIRTSELLTLRGSVLEDHLPAIKPSNNSATYNTKEVLEYVAPELQLNCLRLGVSNNGAEEQLLRLDEQCLTKHYKVGVMYCKAGQSTEEEMYNNQEAGPAFVEFLQMLGQTVRLKDFDKYKAGLDNKTDSTGLYSVYTTYQGCEIMFHVSTMLPYTPNNRQQLLRKRHIGNDIVTIVFQEPGAAPFTPRNIRSQFQHVFVVVRAIDPCSDNTYYSIAVSRAKEVPLFGPPIKEGAIYPKGAEFTDLLLAKVINGENAAIQSPKFSTMATRTRQEYLKDLAKNYVTSTTLDTGQKFSIFSSLLSKGSNHSNCSLVPKPDSGINDVLVAGAFYFHVQLQDEGSGGSLLDCVMGISADTIVFVEEITRQIVLVLPTDGLLGWVVSASGWCLRLYYHRGETVRVCGGGAALRARLSTVAPLRAEPLAELALERGSSSQLGFHVRTDGLVSGVSAGGVAARAGVRAGARLLEVCRAAVTALPHHALLDLLGTADPVTITITYANGRACDCDSDGEGWSRGGARGEVPRVNRRGDSSGYGTGSSGRSEGRTELTHSNYGTGSSTRSAGLNDLPHSGYGTGSSTRSAGQNEPGTGHGTGSSGRSEGRNDSAPVPRRRSHDDRGRHSRHSANTASLTEELMRLMDAELGEGRVSAGSGGGGGVSSSPGTPRGGAGGGGSASPHGGAGGGGSASPRALPLPDAGALDWSALVHTATRAMLQICEEHQYPSLDTTEQSLDASLVEPTQDNWPESTTPVSEWNSPPVPPPPGAAPDSPSRAACGCGLAARVSTLEADAAAAARHRHHLEDEVRRLRRHNARLREESARAVWQLRHFTQWLKRTVDRQ